MRESLSALERFLQAHHRTSVAPLLPVEKQMLATIALFAVLAPLAVWEFDAVRAAPMEPLGAFALGVILGAMTGLGIIVRERWRR